MWMRYLKQGWLYSKSLKNIYIQVQNAVDVKRIVTRLAFFQWRSVSILKRKS